MQCNLKKPRGDGSVASALRHSFVSCGLFLFFPNTPTRTRTHRGARRGNDCLSVLAGGGEPFRVRSACGNYSAQFRPTPPATPLSCGCSSQKMLNTTSLLICSPSDVLLPPTHKRQGGQEVRLFAGLNALIKLSDHSGRDKEVMPPASLMLAAFALCSAINRHGTAVAGVLN